MNIQYEDTPRSQEQLNEMLSRSIEAGKIGKAIPPASSMQTNDTGTEQICEDPIAFEGQTMQARMIDKSLGGVA